MLTGNKTRQFLHCVQFSLQVTETQTNRIQVTTTNSHETRLTRWSNYDKINDRCSEFSTRHVVLVLQEDGQLFEEGNNKDQQLLVLSLKNFDQQSNNVFIPHLQLCPRVLSQIQQQVKRNWKEEEK